MNASQASAMRRAVGHSRGGRRIFVAEWVDEPGRFSAVAEREYYDDAERGQFFRDAVAEFYDGKIADR